MSPFKELYGQDTPLLIKGSTVPSWIEEVNQLTSRRVDLLADLRDNLLKSQDLMRYYTNKHRISVDCAVGRLGLVETATLEKEIAGKESE